MNTVLVSLRTLSVTLFILLLSGQAAVYAQADATLGVGDVVRIAVYGQDDLETVSRITEEGAIIFPLIGQVKVTGLTNRQAEALIEKGLSEGQFVRNPQVSIFVEQRVREENEVVTVIGKVKKPGRFAVDSLSDEGAQSIAGVLALAGGVGDDAADYLILARQTDGKAENLRVDLEALLRNGDLSQNYDLNGGDIVLVPAMDVFFVYGQVEKPGRYRLERGMTVMQAISVGGGLTMRGTEKGLSLRRRTDNGDIVTVKSALNDELLPNDVVVVDESLF